MNPVVLVDDDVLVRELLQEAIEAKGFRVEPAGDGDEAIRLLERARPTLLVTDVNLGPGPDGFEVARYARRVWPDLKVVYITGHAAHMASQCVPDAVMIAKPFDIDVLAARVRSWCCEGEAAEVV